MNYLESYLQTIISRGHLQLADSIKKTVEDVAPTYLEKFSFVDHEVGLLFGNVQSGKTGQMFGIISAASDLGFPVFIILTTDNVLLQQQTIDRVRADLNGYCVCDEYDSEVFVKNSLMEPVIIVLKKNVNTLKQWSNLLASTGFMKGNPLFIIDDEADAASLNTFVNKNKKSSINRYLEEIKTKSASSIYLQVTGTPQAILLQAKTSGWRPYFAYYFRPGNGYLGGDFFFPKTGFSQSVVVNELSENPLKATVVSHLVASAQILIAGGKVCNCLIHPSVRQAVHTQFYNDVKKELQFCIENINNLNFISELKKEFDQACPKKHERKTFEEVYEKIKNTLIKDEIKVLIMNGSSKVISDQYENGSNIIIGGNTLGRGVTFPGLQTIFYTRIAKKPQADTMWQHSRMFGYDRDAGLMKVFIDKKLYKLFSDINATNNSIISQVERGLKEIKIYYPQDILPTRKNVIYSKKIDIISGGTNYYPFSPKNNTIEDLNKLFQRFDETENYYQVSLRLIIEIFDHITSEADFRIKSFVNIIKSMLADFPVAQGILIVRRNRNVARGTGALLSPNDWQLGTTFQDKVVLTVYQVTGDKGWEGEKMWVPNIKLPNDVIYYSVNDDDAEELDDL
ncbi:Z1 domain-containing protein [Saccharibacillus brassicae]|uniref:Restriction endonuclease n=1 Tax=Saccharibacillus brassicae TaxID=2583377 RepID=A0A4Y6UWV2_SACBS|nr:Z1 domain-containing protein [Saccharibacillus brassicae]QDH22193.1 restriction endonuclease [Saccharibacillus brassicae]